MKLKQLEGLLGGLTQFSSPKVELEQYATGPHIASRMLYTAENSFDDISGKVVADFGCGCGTLAVSSALLDAENLLGEDLGPLSMKELEQLDNQIEISLKHIRSTKSQQLLDQLFELKREEQQLQDVNKDLRRKIQETSGENVLHMSCHDVGPSGSCGHANEANQEFLHSAVCDPFLHIGYHQAYLDHLNNE